MKARTRAWVPNEPGPPGGILVHDKEGDGWHWETPERTYEWLLHLSGLFFGAGCGALLVWLVQH